jgi:N-acetylneuraminic acid mutarotase
MITNNRYKKIKITFVIVGLVTVIALTWAGSTKAATWTQKADMPTPRQGHSAAVVNGKIYVIGGIGSETSFLNAQPIPAVEEYDPTTDTWTDKSDMPVPRGYLEGSHPVVDGKIYIIGGGDPALARVDVYDPVTDTWTRAADMPTKRLILAKVAFEGKIYAFGGLAGLGWTDYGLNTTEVYDPQTDTWTPVAPMPQGVWQCSADVVDGKIYVIGGAYNINALQVLQIYDPKTDTWTNATPMPVNTRGHATSVVCGKIYAIGGWLNSTQRPYANTWIYDTNADLWMETTPLPDVRAGFTACVVNGKIYAIGGTNRGHPTMATSTVYELELDSLSPDFNGDGVVNGADAAILVDHWHTDDPSFDIAPGPCGDGIVDTQDLLVLAESIGKEVQDPTLAAHWALDETEGITAHDSASDNDDYVFGGALWQPTGGMIGGALELDGIDDCIISITDISLSENPFSVIAWIKGGSPGQAIISQPGGVNWLATDAEGNLTTELAGPGRNSGPLMSQTIITDGTWHRIGIVWDGSHRMLYVDGVSVAEDIQNSLGYFSSGLYIGVGKDYASGTFFSGLIDDVRIYNRVVNP